MGAVGFFVSHRPCGDHPVVLGKHHGSTAPGVAAGHLRGPVRTRLIVERRLSGRGIHHHGFWCLVGIGRAFSVGIRQAFQLPNPAMIEISIRC